MKEKKKEEKEEEEKELQSKDILKRNSQKSHKRSQEGVLGQKLQKIASQS